MREKVENRCKVFRYILEDLSAVDNTIVGYPSMNFVFETSLFIM